MKEEGGRFTARTARAAKVRGGREGDTDRGECLTFESCPFRVVLEAKTAALRPG